MVGVAGCSLFSPEFERIWAQPLLVDYLIDIAEMRQRAQGDRDLVAIKTMHLIDAHATVTANQGKKEGDLMEWMSKTIFPDRTVSDAEKQRRAAEIIAKGFKAMQERRTKIG